MFCINMQVSKPSPSENVIKIILYNLFQQINRSKLNLQLHLNGLVIPKYKKFHISVPNFHAKHEKLSFETRGFFLYLESMDYFTVNLTPLSLSCPHRNTKTK